MLPSEGTDADALVCAIITPPSSSVTDHRPYRPLHFILRINQTGSHCARRKYDLLQSTQRLCSTSDNLHFESMDSFKYTTYISF